MADLQQWDEEVDVLVVGSGAGGLAAGVTAAQHGLRTIVLEKTEWAGGTTAYSAGTCWMPDNRFQREDGVFDDAERASTYLDHLVGDRAARQLRQAYLDRGPEMLDYLDQQGVRFWPSKKVVDYHPEIDGSSLGGRALEPQTFDGRRLGRDQFRRIRRPVPEFALFAGTLMVRRVEVNRLLEVFHGSLAAAWLALRLGGRWILDLLAGYPRGTRLAMGNALIASLLHTFLRNGGQIRYNSTIKQLLVENGEVVGAIVLSRGQERTTRVRHGVVLAGGGFSASPHWRQERLPVPAPQFTRASDGATGDTIELGLAAGGTLGDDSRDNALWFPSSLGRRPDGSLVVFPHIWDRAKPGIVAVNAAGRRFVDESVSYHRFTRAMYQANGQVPSIPAWLIIDAVALRRYGLGMIRPRLPRPFLTKYVRDGYIVRANGIPELAARIGVDGAGLEETVRAANRAARTGIDEDFGKGTSPFGHQYGDPRHHPNANLGSIDRPPYFALPVVPTPLATSLGLRVDTNARVLDSHGAPIRGLYACGNDADSVMASEYPGAGCQVGAALTFGYVAALHAASGHEPAPVPQP